MSWLFTIIVQPLIHIIELFYSIFYKITDNAGLSVIGLSFIITLFTLPLYMVAEKWQEAERLIQEKLKPDVNRIKKAFKGDEQYMILSTFYKQNHYHPLMALRSSFSLLIQIPFFMAAYSFLSHLEALRGVSFLFIKDFGSPDATFHIGTFTINLLPIAMTIINCVSGVIYSKGHQLSEKLQIYGCAAVFLVLLYNSPAGLVVYWTMNNVLSLLKNIFYKLKNPKKVIYIISCIIALCLIILPFTPFKTPIKIINLGLMGIGILIPFLPFVIIFIYKLINSHFQILDTDTKLRDTIFFTSIISIALLAGLCIPSMIVSSEPVNYAYVDSVTPPHPLLFVRYTMFLAIGFFVFWPFCFYELFSSKIKKIFTVLFSLLSFGAIINTFAFSGEYGSLLPECLFMFDVTIDVPLKEIIIHIFVIAIVSALLVFLLLKFPKIISSCSFIVILSLSFLILKNTITINKEFKDMTPAVAQKQIEPIYHLSKTGENVIIIMQDRLYSPFVNEAFKEFPELETLFDGFVYYPNSVSNGWLTMLGSPELFGGYDFTPYEMNKRTNETLQQKHNKALLTMPIIFNKAGFSTTVTDLPYENFLEYPIDNMYKDYPFVVRENIKGIYTDLWYNEHNIPKSQNLAKAIKRNMIWFSIFKMLPPFARDFIYYNEYWNSEIHSADNNLNRFIENYAVLDYLPELTDFASKSNSFVLIDNEMTHEPTILQYPEYEPGIKITAFGASKYSHDPAYCTTVAALKKYVDFISYLKENDVYDNTRIIIVSDHGTSIDVDDFENNIPNLVKGTFIATLLVKDFNKNGTLQKDMTFMTNADTPYLAAKDIIPNAKNPFTNNPLQIDNKNDYTILANGRPEGTRARFNTRLDISDNEWFYVKDNIFVNDNWGKFTK